MSKLERVAGKTKAEKFFKHTANVDEKCALLQPVKLRIKGKNPCY